MSTQPLPNQPKIKELEINFPSWSISVEFYTYLIFGLILVFFLGCLSAFWSQRSRRTVPGFISLLILLVLIAFLQFKPAGEGNWLVFPMTAALIISLIHADHGMLKRIVYTCIESPMRKRSRQIAAVRFGGN